MKKVLQICKSIENAKIKEATQILKENKDNEKLFKVLDFVFNPYITSGISDKKYNKIIKAIPTKTFKSFLEVLEYIKINNTGTDEVICNIRNYVKDKPKEIQDFIHDVITKQLKLGIAITSINKAYGYKAIPTFDVQLAEKYYDNIEEVQKNNKPFTLTLKLDGHRCLIVKNKDDVRIYARSGQLIEGCEEIENVIRKSKYKAFVLDGELLAKIDSKITSQERFRKTLKSVHRKGIKNDLEFFAFDLMSYKEFKNKEGTRTYLERRKILSDIINDMVNKNKNCPIIYLPSMYCGTDFNKVEELLAKVKRKHLEGLMMNINDAKYEFKRTKSLLKIKVMDDVDLRIIRMENGNGKLKNTIGKIYCDYKGYELGVGSGLTDEDREDMLNNPDKYIGKLAKIQYFEETKNEQGNLSLRFPVYLGLVIDKEYGNFEGGQYGKAFK